MLYLSWIIEMTEKLLKFCVRLFLIGSIVASNMANATVSSHWLAPTKVDCFTNQQCFNVLTLSETKNNKWLPYRRSIDGFNFESGDFYKVQLNDFVSGRAKLVQVLERTSQHFLSATKLVAKQQWQLTLLNTLPKGVLNTLAKKPYISLSNQGINGFSGCNNIFGKQEYIFEANNYQQSMIKFGPMAMTRMACREKSANQIEHQVSLLFTQVNKFSVDWPILNFYHNNELLAQFTAQ